VGPRGRHLAARVEDVIDDGLRAAALRRGWTPRVTTSTGYGGRDGIRVFARVLLTAATERPTPSGRPRSPRGWRSLLTVPAVGVDVAVAVGGVEHSFTSDRGGYVHGDVPVALAPGWHEAAVTVAGRAPVTARVRVVDEHTTRGVISDVDDTILVTWLPRPLRAAWNTFFLREHARRPVPGMSELLRRLTGDDGFMVYVSTGAWNFAAHLERFIAEHDFPPGPLLLTDWGPTEDRWFRSGAAHKRDALERLRRDHPTTRWVLVGDDGQRDPAIYGAFAAAHPDAVEAVAIRTLSPTQRALAAPTPRRAERTTAALAPTTRWVCGADGDELRAALDDLARTGDGHQPG
jgi:phosphatidate phosphatase APP1